MTTEFIDLDENPHRVGSPGHNQGDGLEKGNHIHAFVVDEERRLKGTVRLEDIILASPDAPVSGLMDEHPVFTSTETDREEAAGTMSKYDLQAMPVLDREHRLVGILTFDDILDVVQEEATEDFERMAGISPVEISYMARGFSPLPGRGSPGCWSVSSPRCSHPSFSRITPSPGKRGGPGLLHPPADRL